MTDPALFWVVIPLVVSHYASVKINTGSISANLLGLRCPGISSINHRLNNRGPEDTDDAMIGAIAKMASYEAMFGSRENHNIHRQGLVRASSLGGELSTLGFNGIL